MKIIKHLVIFVFLSTFLLFINYDGKFSDGVEELNLFIWGDYIDMTLVNEFEKETGIKVNIDTFDSNESMYSKIKKDNSYDILVPSDYMIERLIQEDLVQEIDKNKLENYVNVDTGFENNTFDPQNIYSIPYFWGTVGIVYNEKMLNDLNVDDPTQWTDLSNPLLEDQILFFDSSRDVLGIFLLMNGYSINTENINEINKSLESSTVLIDNTRGFIGDEMIQVIPNEEAAIGITWSGSAHEMIDKNNDLSYVVPSNGSNIWIDSMVISKNAQNLDNAYQFIDFILEEENIQKNAEYVGYSTVNKKNAGNLDQFSSLTDETNDFYNYLGPELEQTYSETFLQLKINFSEFEIHVLYIIVIAVIITVFLKILPRL